MENNNLESQKFDPELEAIKKVRAKAASEGLDQDEAVRILRQRWLALAELQQAIRESMGDSGVVTSKDDWDAAVKKREDLNNNK